MSFVALLRKLFSSNEPSTETHMTPRATQVVTVAREGAVQVQQAATLQHLSIALLSLNEGCAMNVLARWPIDIVALRKAVAAQVEATPLDSALDVARAEQRRLGHWYLGTEHLLLALVQHGQNTVAQLLQQQGMDLTKAREQVLKELDPNFKEA